MSQSNMDQDTYTRHSPYVTTPSMQADWDRWIRDTPVEDRPALIAWINSMIAKLEEKPESK